MATTDKATEPVKTKVENTYTKAQLVGSKRYADRRDALNVVLKNDGLYTFAQVDTLLDKFMRLEVK